MFEKVDPFVTRDIPKFLRANKANIGERKRRIKMKKPKKNLISVNLQINSPMINLSVEDMMSYQEMFPNKPKPQSSFFII